MLPSRILIDTDINSDRLLEASMYIDEQLNRNSESKVVKAFKSKNDFERK
jgi:hypothetical protein